MFATTIIASKSKETTAPPQTAIVEGVEALDELTLLDWKRRIFELYASIRADPDPEHAWRRWRATRDELFRSHPQSPVPAARRASFAGLPYFDYDPAFRVLATVEAAEPVLREIATSGEQPYTFRRFARARFTLAERGADARPLLARGVRRRHVPLVRRRDERPRHVRRVPLPARHGQGRRPGRARRWARARLQLRLQPVLLVRRPLGLPAGAPGEPARPRGARRGAALIG